MKSENRKQNIFFFFVCSMTLGLLITVLTSTHAQDPQATYIPNDPGKEQVVIDQLGFAAAWGMMKNHSITPDPKGLPIAVILGGGVVRCQHPDLIAAALPQYDKDLRTEVYTNGHESAVAGAGFGQTDNGLGPATPGGLYYGNAPFGLCSVAIGNSQRISGPDLRRGLDAILDLIHNQHINVVEIGAAFNVNDDDPQATRDRFQQLSLLGVATVCAAGENTNTGSLNVDTFPAGSLSPVCWGGDPELLMFPVTGLNDDGTLYPGDYFGKTRVTFNVPVRSIPTVSYLFDMTDGNARIGDTSGGTGLVGGMGMSVYLQTEHDMRSAFRRLETSGINSSFCSSGRPNLGNALLMEAPTLSCPTLSSVEWNGAKRLDVFGSFSANAKVFVGGQLIDPGFAITQVAGQIGFKAKPKKLHLIGDPGAGTEVLVLDRGLPSNIIKITV